MLTPQAQEAHFRVRKTSQSVVSLQHGKGEEVQQVPEGDSVASGCEGKWNHTFITRIYSSQERNVRVKATMENGLLIITFPKSTPDMAPKKINIS
ncbi:hypothetical protein M378DRAFT_169523 [Amanita muscaria Koide BX008]|uniref:SHSP domain-containing protein n=1 Tax=Amanita muscaria (strain Koide BX008) TaxID=946122 RepID=A0A0C2WD39_AMAMK|nr:hypothetical protein M378DRAFT_169523 [Amanita muscaria Koide BX008]